MKIYEFFENLLGQPDILQLFGDTGTQKSFLMWQMMKEIANDKKSVLYVDTERNITTEELDEMKKAGVEYTYLPSFEDLIEFTSEIKPYDWIIVDSIGLPALGQFAIENLQGRGNILLNIQAILYRFKIISAKNNSYIIAINQPTSEMGKNEWITYQPKGWNRQYKFIKTEPFADKGNFFAKETIRTINIFENTSKTITDLMVWKSRNIPKYTTLARLTRTSDDFKWEVLI